MPSRPRPSHPDRVRVVGVVAGIGPLLELDPAAPTTRPSARPSPVTRSGRWRSMRRRPRTAIASVGGARPATIRVGGFVSPEILEPWTASGRPGMPSYRGVSRDSLAFTAGWDVELADVRAPVHLWYGTATAGRPRARASGCTPTCRRRGSSSARAPGTSRRSWRTGRDVLTDPGRTPEVRVGAMSAPVLHVRGRVLVGPDDVVDELWVIGGRVSFTPPPTARDVQTLEGWVLPGLVDAHCHVGLGPHGAVPRDEAEQQAITDRDRGTLLIRDAGQPGDTRWVDEREDLPKIIRAGRHIARTRRYIRNYAHEVEEDELVRHVRLEAHRGDGWVKLVGDWIDRDVGDLAPSWSRQAVADAIAAAHEEGVRVTAHCFGEESLRDLAAAGIDCIEHATGLREDSIDTFAAQGIAIVPTLVNIAQFPRPRRAGRRRSSPATTATCSTCTSGATPPSARRTRRACRSTSAPTPAAACPHGLVAAGDGRADEGGAHRRRGRLGRDVGRPRVARPTRHRRGRGRRPRRLRVRPARRRHRRRATRSASSCEVALSSEPGEPAADEPPFTARGSASRCAPRRRPTSRRMPQP